MKRIYNISLFVCFLFLISCYNYIDVEGGGYLPKRMKYEFQHNPYQLKFDDPISADLVYVTLDTFKYGENDKYQSLLFFKFYENGRVHANISDVSEMNKVEELNYKFQMGYYKINGEEIIVELFRVKAKERGWMVKYKGKVNNDTLYFLNGSDYFKPSQKYLRYVPRKIEGLDQNTHW